MTKTELTRSMERFFGAAFITRQQLVQFMGKRDPHSVDAILSGLKRVDGKYYYAADVAEALLSRTTIK